MITTSETQKPNLSPGIASFERGLDPWHADAFPDGFKDVGTTGARRKGWDALDWCGNVIGFVPDGTPLGVNLSDADQKTLLRAWTQGTLPEASAEIATAQPDSLLDIFRFAVMLAREDKFMGDALEAALFGEDEGDTKDEGVTPCEP